MRGAALLGFVLVGGTVGYILFGIPFVEALYQTVTTVSTVGFREVRDFGTGERLLTIAVIVGGVGAALFTFSALVEALVEGRLSQSMQRRRMARQIAAMEGHIIVCGWGRVGKTVADYAVGYGADVVVIDVDPARIADTDLPCVLGDATSDICLRDAGIERAKALIAALASDADNLFVTLTARGLNPDLFIVARARVSSTESKMLQAGANRVVNPQHLGGARMAALANQPHVAEFLDVVMHDGSLDFRLEEVAVPASSPVAGRSLREAQLRDQTGALVLAMKKGGEFETNPDPSARIEPDTVLIAIGTADQLDALGHLVAPP